MWKKMFIVLGRLFMRRSKGVSTGGPDTPSCMEKHKAVIILGLLVRKVHSYRCRVIIGTLTRRHLYDVCWRADGCPFWLLSVSMQVYCNEYGKIMRQTRHWK